jgi:hypothetical protein
MPMGTCAPTPGNTVICFANPDDAPYQVAVRVQHRVKDLAIFPKVVLMPPSSLHMTVMGLLLDAVAPPDYWTRHLPLTTPSRNRLLLHQATGDHPTPR